MLPDAGRIKQAVKNMCDKAADLGVEHSEQEIGVRPRTFAREKHPISTKVDKIIGDYSDERAFYITGLAKQEILDKAKAFITEWVKDKKSPYPDDEMVNGLKKVLEDWLPKKDASGRTINTAARAETIARTNVSDLYNYSRYSVFTSDFLSGWVVAFQYSAIMDTRTTEICRSLHNKIFTKDTINGFIPPNHFNCRSILLPITALDQGWQSIMENQGDIEVRPQLGFE